ncbi:hypothetical protein [Roseibium aggregatum]|uniref:Uncharacterized protein n=1 Tax=Roseibium aggregatum TaxID=187304 RepID=A0A926NWA1_9HYPH|nr:hypothetical protein [Roseibium aggregatum]MBD1546464.1 hypothetical protein [Roseibium aggregatum]
MDSVSSAGSAASQAAGLRSELATNAIRDANEQEQAVADRLEDAQSNEQEARRQQRQIPGLGQAVDITA